ncbi:hypothetical protein GVAV_001321 [Gurleya vavrai]
MSSSDWEEANLSSDYLEQDFTQNKNKLQRFFKALSSIHFFNNVTFDQYIDLDLLKEKIPLNVLHAINLKLNNIDVIENAKNVIKFKLFIFYRLKCRILCHVNDKNFDFFMVENAYEKITIKRKKGVFFSIDDNFNINDLGFFWSSGNSKIGKSLSESEICNFLKTKYLADIDVINDKFKYQKDLNHVNNFYYLNDVKNDFFEKLDSATTRKIPTSLQFFKKHPLYILDSLLKPNQLIHPKRPIHGYFKGEPIYSKENIQNLLTEKQLYKLGKKQKSNQPFRIIEKNGEKIYLYAKWQTEEIQKIGLDSGKRMDYLHQNHKPIDCAYINHEFAAFVAEMFKFDFRHVCIEIRREPIFKGIFIHKKDVFLFCNILDEYLTYENILNKLKEKERVFEMWKSIINKVSKYKKLKERI